MRLLPVAAPALLLAAASSAWLGHAVTDRPMLLQNTNEEAAAHEKVDKRAQLKLPLVRPRIVVSKSARRLELFSDGRVVREYRVVLGGDPVNDKEREGDSRTPEGEFYVCVKNERSQFYRSLGLSYPNREDAERGLRDRLITRDEYERIARAISRRRTPPWDTALGGEIFIHGGGTANDWPRGCIALDNADMQELFDSIPVGTPVSIKP